MDQRLIQEAQKLFDRQLMIMKVIIEAEGEHTKFWADDLPMSSTRGQTDVC